MRAISQIREALASVPEGTPITSSSLLHAGSRASVDQALSRLAREGELSRVARGVYARPQRNRFVGEVPPEPFLVAEAVARDSGAVVEWHGAEAARRLGLATQVPSAPVFLTNGSPRKIRMGTLTIELRRAAPRKLHFAGRPAGQALSALWYLGRRGVTPQVIRHLKRVLPPGEFDALAGCPRIMPAWMAEAFEKSRG